MNPADLILEKDVPKRYPLISAGDLRRARVEGKIGHYPIGRKICYAPEQIAAYLATIVKGPSSCPTQDAPLSSPSATTGSTPFRAGPAITVSGMTPQLEERSVVDLEARLSSRRKSSSPSSS
jgi:hypothetical protein